MEQGGAEEAQLAGEQAHYRLVEGEGLYQKHNVLNRGEAECGGNEVNRPIYRLVGVGRFIKDQEDSQVLYHFFHTRPADYLPFRVRHVSFNYFFQGQNESHGDYARKETSGQESGRLGLFLVFLQPEPQPKKGGNDSSHHC